MDKGVGHFEKSSQAPNWNLLREDVSFPAAVLDLQKMNHNLRWMQTFVDLYNYKLCPHGKTTMCPEIFQKQISGGAWGITLATAQQTAVAHNFGIKRVLMANQLVGRENMGIIARIQESDPEFEFYCCVDNTENVRALGQYFGERKQSLKILLEFGVEGGRNGVRGDPKEEDEILEEIANWPGVMKLSGVEFYEGILQEEKLVRELIRRVISRFLVLLERGVFCRSAASNSVIISGSGSAWYDVVGEELSCLQDLNVINSEGIGGYQITVVLRPGCYVTHGLKMYADIDERLVHKNPVDGNGLQQAMTIWAYVQSRPERGIVIVGMGKREVLDDCGMPVPWRWVRMEAGTSRVKDKDRNFSEHLKDERREMIEVGGRKWQLRKLMDQHGFLEVGKKDWEEIGVGDLIVFRICHPCTTFDKWRCVLGVDEEFNVKNIFKTCF